MTFLIDTSNVSTVWVNRDLLLLICTEAIAKMLSDSHKYLQTKSNAIFRI